MTALVNTINTLRYDPDLCIGCEMCSVVCPHGVFRMDGRVAQLVRVESCIECGACQRNCPVGAITVESGVGCAAAMFIAALRGRKGASCNCDETACCCGG